MIKPLLRHPLIPLAVGALSATLLISSYAMFWYEIPVGGNPHWIVEPGNIMKVFPVHLFYFFVGACSALLAFLSHRVLTSSSKKMG